MQGRTEGLADTIAQRLMTTLGQHPIVTKARAEALAEIQAKRAAAAQERQRHIEGKSEEAITAATARQSAVAAAAKAQELWKQFKEAEKESARRYHSARGATLACDRRISACEAYLRETADPRIAEFVVEIDSLIEGVRRAGISSGERESNVFGHRQTFTNFASVSRALEAMANARDKANAIALEPMTESQLMERLAKLREGLAPASD